MRKRLVTSKALVMIGNADRPRSVLSPRIELIQNDPEARIGLTKSAGTSERQIEPILRPMRKCYAGTVIDDPSRFDAIEIHGVSELSDSEGVIYEEPSCDWQMPNKFSVYAHLKHGGIDCCGDFALRSDALAYGEELASAHGWTIGDYTLGPRINNHDSVRRDALMAMAVALGTGFGQALQLLDEDDAESDRPAIRSISAVLRAGLEEIRRQLHAAGTPTPRGRLQ